MTLHLIKLSVGPDSLSELAEWQEKRAGEMKAKGQKVELMHVTRHMPKRAEELLDGGSIFWVIKGFLCARQTLLDLRPVMRSGTKRCAIVYDKKLIRIIPRRHRAFQGWRYFDPKDAPADLKSNKRGEAMPEELQRELAELGLL